MIKCPVGGPHRETYVVKSAENYSTPLPPPPPRMKYTDSAFFRGWKKIEMVIFHARIIRLRAGTFIVSARCQDLQLGHARAR